METPVASLQPPAIRATTSEITLSDRLDHFLARWGFRRMGHLVEPGLYALGRPGKESPVFVTANYTLSFDALRGSLKGVDGYLLVLNTYGINVWCAAGKGTFGTDELGRRIEAAGLAVVVSHRRLILPQLGAPGVDAFQVTKRTGFRVEYGPVRAADLPEYLKAGKATPEMRRVRFPLRDRAVLIPVELVAAMMPPTLVPIAALMAVAFLAAGWPALLAMAAALLTGLVAFPLLLPYVPTKDYSTKGLLLGLLAALPFAAYQYASGPPAPSTYASMLMFVLLMPPVAGYLALNFTGSTPYPSRTGVRKEIFTYVPIMAGMAVLGLLVVAGTIALGALKVI